MNTTGRENLGECKSTMLIAKGTHPVDVCHVTLKSGTTALEKGTVLAVGTDGKCVALAADVGTAAYILAEDTEEATTDTTVEAFRSGCFARESLIVSDGYTMTDTDERNLRNGGIFIESIMQY